jgi:erythromycin esterase-like protein
VKVASSTVLHRCAIATLVLLTVAARPGRADPALADAIRRRAIPLSTVSAGHGFDDMKRIADIVGSARIVALGESSHGSREIFQLKHRMVEFLASRMGFSIFAIEASMSDAALLNDYVQRGRGDPSALIQKMGLWPWSTEEVLDLVRWMRDFNRRGAGRIAFAGFDMQMPDTSIDVVREYLARHEPAYLTTVDAVLDEVRKAELNGDAGIVAAEVAIRGSRRSFLRLSGYIKSERIFRGYAGLWCRVDGRDEQGRRRVLGFAEMSQRGVHGTTPWTRYGVALDLPAGAESVHFGVVHTGDGTAWFDALQLEKDGAPYAVGPIDLDFESEGLRGFRIRRMQHDIGIDTKVAYAGKQSLRSTFSTVAIDPASVRLVERCEGIVGGLKKRTPPTVEGAWLVQNGQLILQFVRLQAHLQQRDELMAENVRWIAAHHPSAKIIVWAHNAHVSHRSTYEMGGHLRGMFGSKFMNFGILFNHGSFRAVGLDGRVQEFTVDAMPEGSVEATLASVGFPLFALDLRSTEVGRFSQWVNSVQSMRTIGAVFDASSMHDVRPAEAFDALLYMDVAGPTRPLEGSAHGLR